MSTYFFRVINQEDGSWSCRRGREDFDFHAQLDDAIEHTERPSRMGAGRFAKTMRAHRFGGFAYRQARRSLASSRLRVTQFAETLRASFRQTN